MVKCENYLRYFKRYTDKFFTEVSDEDRYKIELKIVHTMNVLKLMRRIAKEKGLTGEDYEIAKVIALFHDLGRFNQIKLYGTFSDKDSINHAEESVRELKRMNILDGAGDTYVPAHNKELIYKAILNHNKNRDVLDFGGDEKLKLMSELIRDCDKIDIYRSVEKYVVRQPIGEYMRAEGISDPSPEITDGIFQNVMNNENVLMSNMKTVGDHAAYYMN
ncbi:MAG: HD domain-containing protein [Clostridia bacterium]|nr:HD domain-containing protein [Clostridia bacterium]